MSDFSFSLKKNRALSSRIALLERELALDPDDYALEKDLRSMTRLAQRYMANAMHVEARTFQESTLGPKTLTDRPE